MRGQLVKTNKKRQNIYKNEGKMFRERTQKEGSNMSLNCMSRKKKTKKNLIPKQPPGLDNGDFHVKKNGRIQDHLTNERKIDELIMPKFS